MNAYSEDLRKKIVQAPRRGMGKSEAARSFGVSLSSVERYARMADEGRSLAPKKRPGSEPKLDDGARRLLESDVAERPVATLLRRREHLQKVGGRGRSSKEGVASSSLPAALLARLRPDRASVLEGQGAHKACRRAYPRGPDRGDGPSALGGHGSGHARVLRPLWSPHLGPTAMTGALGLSDPPPLAVLE